MNKYDGKPLLEKVKHSAPRAYLKYYATKETGYWQKFTKIYKIFPIGEIYLTSDALYVFRGTRKVFSNPRKTGIKIDRKEIRGAQLVESDLHLNLTQKGYDTYHAFYKSHFLLYMKNWHEDSETNSISFYGIDEKDAMKFLENLGDKPEMKIEIKQVKVQQQKSSQKPAPEKIDIPTKLYEWVAENRKSEDFLDDIAWKILIFLYENKGVEWTIEKISKNIGQDRSITRDRIYLLHKKIQVLKAKSKGRQKKAFWYFLPKNID